MQAAAKDYCARHDDFFAHAFELEFRAQRMDQRLKDVSLKRGLFGNISKPFLRAAYGYERAALRAQAHQSFVFAVTQKKNQPVMGFYDPDHFNNPKVLEPHAHLSSVKRTNIENGHGYLYKSTP